MNSTNINPLLVRPYPETLESWRGYVLRISELNGLSSPKHMLRYANESEGNLRTTFPHISTLAALTNKAQSELDLIYPVNHSDDSYKMLGHIVKKQYIRVNTPALCTCCIKELKYIPARWDLVYTHVCHIHRRQLVRNCPSCKEPLKWYRKGLMICHCGYDFSDAVGETAKMEEVNFAEILALILERRSIESLIDQSINPIPKAIQKMNLFSFLGVFNAIGLAKLGADGKMDEFEPVGSYEAYSCAAHIYSNWSVEFERLLKKVQSKATGTESSPRSLYRNLYNAIFQKGYPKADLIFVLEEMIRATKTTNPSAFIDRRLSNKVNIAVERRVGIGEAAKKLGIMPSTLRKRIQSGKVDFCGVQKRKDIDLYLFDPETLVTKQVNTEGELGRRAAAAHVGLPVTVLISLRESKHYLDHYSTVLPKTWAIPDLNVLRVRMLGTLKSIPVDKPDDLIPIRKAMLIKFKSSEIKADVIRNILDKKLSSYGPADKIGDVLVSKSELMKLSKLTVGV